jgi:hypothetical protein
MDFYFFDFFKYQNRISIYQNEGNTNIINFTLYNYYLNNSLFYHIINPYNTIFVK